MSYLVLARKYRPQTFDELVSQTHVSRTLKNAITADRVAHAILFSGPRGTGKTTVARILAKAMNCKIGPAPTPCNECISCKEITSGISPDVFEIDGASNNSVDQIRELRDNIKYKPSRSLYKIYIIDEVHMLSIAAFNALLKTLEEPPPHIMFFFATTESHKIPLTILSRCQRHDFKRIDLKSISKHLANLAEKEGAVIDEESLYLIAREAGGCMRDALSLLDQIIACAEGPATIDQTVELLGVVDRRIFFDISEAVLKSDIPKLLDILDDVYDRGHDMKRLHSDLVEHFRNLLIAKMDGKKDRLINLPDHEIMKLRDQINDIGLAHINQVFDLLYKEEPTIRFSTRPKLALEMAFIRMAEIKPALSIDELIKSLDNLKQSVIVEEKKTLSAKGKEILQTEKPQKKPETNSRPIYDPDPPMENFQEKLLSAISEKSPVLAANLNNSVIKKPVGNLLEIEANGSRFDISRINQGKSLSLIKSVSDDFLGKDIKVVIMETEYKNDIQQNSKKRINILKKEALEHPMVAQSIEIFNGDVVDIKAL